ncbi:MAG: ABC transporter permease [Salaquimonas sp.]|jgi:ribose/xylose/arabinose/galactoside ABC-type transport system permease subunit|nr:ABC transporter permease [Salaquimonas sp.]
MTDNIMTTQNRRRFASFNISRAGKANLVFALGILALIVATSLMSDAFLTERNMTNVARQMVTTGLLSIGMLVVILSGGIDLSVGSVVAFAGLLAAGLQETMPIGAAIAIALSVGVAVGIINGVFVAYFRLQPFIVTLATMGAVRGALYIYSETPTYASDPFFISVLGSGKLFGVVPYTFLIFLVCIPIMWMYLNHTKSGRSVIAIGMNPEAVRLAGVDVRVQTTVAYVICGFFAALAGVLLSARLGISQPNVGVGYELDAIAAVVIGGGVLGGGGGTVGGMFGGVLALAVIDNVLNLFNVQSYYQQLVKGVIILIAVIVRRKPQG